MPKGILSMFDDENVSAVVASCEDCHHDACDIYCDCFVGGSGGGGDE